MNIKDTAAWTLVPACIALLAACGAERSEDTTAKTEAPAETAEQAATPGFKRSPSPPGAQVYFANVEDGDTVTSPVSLEFGIEGMQVVPAGTEMEDSGHHHVIIDSALPPMDTPIPADEQHVHFGDGSTATELPLSPGEHTLQLLFADYLHIPHEPPVVSEQITVTVE